MHSWGPQGGYARCWRRNASGARPGVGGGFGAVGVGAGVVEEGVAGAGVDCGSRSGLPRALEDAAQLVDVGERDQRVLRAEQAEVRTAQPRRQLERARRLDGRSSRRSAACRTSSRRRRGRRHVHAAISAYWPPMQKPVMPIAVGAHVRPAAEVAHGAGEVGEHARVGQLAHPAEHRFHVGQVGRALATVEVDREREEALARRSGARRRGSARRGRARRG